MKRKCEDGGGDGNNGDESNNGEDGNDSNDGEKDKNLYELLDTRQSGIPERILPPVLGARLRRVYWIKNTW